MPDLRRRYCRECGRPSDEVGALSWTGLCIEDSKRLLEENIDGLHTMTGHVRDRWARGMILSAGGVLPERLQQGS